MPAAVQVALAKETAASFAVDVWHTLLDAGVDAGMLARLNMPASEQLDGVAAVKLRTPDRDEAYMSVWRHLTGDSDVARAFGQLDPNAQQPLQKALCDLGRVLTHEGINELLQHQRNLSTIASSAERLLHPQNIEDWIALLSQPTQREVPYDNTSPTCLICHDEAQNEDDKRYVFSNVVCSAHSECMFAPNRCVCRALFCVGCAALLFQRH